MRSTDSPDDDSQQGPDSVGARPRGDCSSVAKCSDADLEQTEAQSPSYMLQISSWLAWEKESVKSSKDRQPRETVPDVLEAREW